MNISLSDSPRLLLRFSFRRNGFFDLPFSKDIPITEIKQSSVSSGPTTGELFLERPLVNAEFLPDFLQEDGFFLQKVRGQSFVSTGRAAILFEYGRKEKRVRGIELLRKTEMNLLGEAAWGMRVYKNPDQESFPICINFACRRPYFSLSGEPLGVYPEFVFQKKEGLIFVESLVVNQGSAA